MIPAFHAALAWVGRTWPRIQQSVRERLQPLLATAWTAASPVLKRAFAWTEKPWNQVQQSLSWRLYAMLLPTAIAGIWIGIEARAGLTENATGLIEATQIKQMVIESYNHVLVQDEASMTMVLFPDDTTAMARKIKAFDANTAILAALANHVQETGLRAMIRHLKSIADNRLAPADTDLSEAAGAGNLAKASEIYRTRFLAARRDYEETARRAAQQAEHLAARAGSEMARRNLASLRTIFAVLVIGVGAALGGLVLLFRMSVVKPLVDASEAMATVATGDFSKKVSVTAKHEIGRVAEAVNGMLDSVRDSIHGISGSSREVAFQAQALHHVSQSMEDGATRASSEAAQVSNAGKAMMDSVHQSSALLGTLASSITQVSRDTDQAAALARNAVRMTRETRQSVQRLAESGAVIDSVTEAMNRVAFETNILALNAAIEAARQGVAGRGFAIVAKQIRSMAEQTQQATSEISRRVGVVHEGITAAVSGISAIDQSIMQLAAIAASIAAETKRQGNASTQLEGRVDAIMTSTAEISKHLADVAQVIDQTRAGANRTRAGADAVAASVEELDRMLAHFRV